MVIHVAEADFADFSKSLKPKKSIHDENFQWFCTVLAYRRQHFAPPSFNERFPEKHNANIHLIFGCANDGKYNLYTHTQLKPLPFLCDFSFLLFVSPSGADIQWSIPVETNKWDEKYLALPLFGDIKLTSCRDNKTIKILLEHIDFVSRHQLSFGQKSLKLVMRLI